MSQYLFCWLASVVVCRLSSVVCHRRLSSSVTLPAGGPAGRQTRGRSARRRPGAWAVGRPTLRNEPVVLRPVKEIPCWNLKIHFDHQSTHHHLTGRAVVVIPGRLNTVSSKTVSRPRVPQTTRMCCNLSTVHTGNNLEATLSKQLATLLPIALILLPVWTGFYRPAVEPYFPSRHGISNRRLSSSSVVVCNAADGRAGGPPGSWVRRHSSQHQQRWGCGTTGCSPCSSVTIQTCGHLWVAFSGTSSVRSTISAGYDWRKAPVCQNISIMHSCCASCRSTWTRWSACVSTFDCVAYLSHAETSARVQLQADIY